jgi:pyrroloquinoline quinone biosynthesis protein D
MISAIARPRLSSKVRLRLDHRTGCWLLLYPEVGLELNGTATEIVRLCTGEWTVDDIVLRLAQMYPNVSPCDLKGEIRHFLAGLAGRGLLQVCHD